MKRILLAVLAVALLAGGALAAIPAVNLQAIYTEDGSAVDVSAIVPYKEVEFRYTITADTPSVTYQFFVMGDADGNNIHNIHNTGTIASTAGLSYKYKVTFSSKETGYVSLFVTDANNMIGSNQNDFTTVYGVPPVVPVTGVELSIYPYITKGKNITLDLDWLSGWDIKAVITPDNATNKKIKWASNNEDVATVKTVSDVDNRVSSVTPGKATITATTEDGGFVASCNVTVTGYGTSTIALDPQTITIPEGAETSVSIENGGFLAEYQIISWDIEDASIAELIKPDVSAPQYICGVRGIKAGTTKIIASTIGNTGDTISATATVTVTKTNNSDGKNTPTDNTSKNDKTPENNNTPESNKTPDDNSTVPDGPTSPISNQKSSSSGGGCNTGWMGLFALALLPIVRKYRTTAQR